MPHRLEAAVEIVLLLRTNWVVGLTTSAELRYSSHFKWRLSTVVQANLSDGLSDKATIDIAADETYSNRPVQLVLERAELVCISSPALAHKCKF